MVIYDTPEKWKQLLRPFLTHSVAIERIEVNADERLVLRLADYAVSISGTTNHDNDDVTIERIDTSGAVDCRHS